MQSYEISALRPVSFCANSLCAAISCAGDLAKPASPYIASHADVLRGSSRVPAPRTSTFVGQKCVTNPLERLRGRLPLTGPAHGHTVDTRPNDEERKPYCVTGPLRQIIPQS